MSRSFFSRSLFVLMLCLPFGIQAKAADAPPRHVKIALIPERAPVKGKEAILIGIEQTIEPGWHTYWANPGDSGEAMRIKWTLPEGFEISDLRWPVPQIIKIGPLINYGYKDKAMIFQDLTLPENLPDGPVKLTAHIETLVCAEICVPEYDDLTLTLNDGQIVDNGLSFEPYLDRLPSDVSGIQNATFGEKQPGRLYLSLSLTQPGLIMPENKDSVAFIPLDWGAIKNTSAQTVTLDGEALTIEAERGERPLTDLKTLSGLLVYTEKGTVDRALSVVATSETIVAAPVIPPVSESVITASGDKNVKAEATGFIKALWLALLGGMILNLMPCVFPVLSMKALSLLKMPEKERAHARLYGIVYTLGILTCFLLVAGLLLALKAGGAEIGWGFQLQNPVVVLALSWLLFVIGLNFSGLFEISGSFSNVGAGLARHEGLKGSFFTGMLAAIVATPCTAPFMGAAIGYALVESAPVALSVFMALGFGLALPYLLICFLPPLQRLLPRPGHWMQTLREFLAFPMFASAAWLVWVYASQVGINGVLTGLAGFIILAMVLWLLTHVPSRGRGRFIVTALAAILIALLGLLAWTSEAPQPPHREASAAINAGQAQPFTPEKLETLLQGNDPVFVNMTAAWCITCKINEKVALKSAEVEKLFRDRNVQYLKGDWTNQDKDITAFLERYGRNGVPLYVYYGPKGPDGKRPGGIVLPQILTPAIVRETIAQK
jgi:thiol:disulfide interchange protein DsbD